MRWDLYEFFVPVGVIFTLMGALILGYFQQGGVDFLDFVYFGAWLTVVGVLLVCFGEKR